MSDKHHIGQRISYDGAVCTVRYIGSVAGTKGSWLGVEWDDVARGKHDGSYKGARYFTCLSKSQTAASFVRPTRPADAPQSFIAALKEKYMLDSSSQSKPRAQIYFSTKLAEEVGFEKIWRQQSQLQELRIVVVENLRVTSVTTGDEATVAETCPKIVQLDLSRNLFEGLGPVVDICGGLPYLQKLAINGNRFRNVLDDEALTGSVSAFGGVRELALADTMLSWEELVGIAAKCPSLTTLLVGTNQLWSLPTLDYLGLSSTLTSINLEFNEFSSLSDIASLASLGALRSLFLKGNNISCLKSPTGGPDSPPVFPDALEYLDLSYNKVASWDFVDGLTTCFPGLAGLRIAHNPIYDLAVGGDSATQSSDESFMFTIARIAQLVSLNFSNITSADRSNAEMFYLSRIAKQLTTVPESAEHTITALHPRYAELCIIYGEPDVIRRQEVNPSFLESRLVTVEFYYEVEGEQQQQQQTLTKRENMRIPKSYDIYRIKGMVGKRFGLSPLKLRLVWETGDWDPVAGFDEEEDESSDEEEEEASSKVVRDEDGGVVKAQDQPGRWMKREVELKDGPKLLGYCVDGSRVTIRVEGGHSYYTFTASSSLPLHSLDAAMAAQASAWKWRNYPSEEEPQSPTGRKVTLHVPPDTDIWRPARDEHKFTAPVLYTTVATRDFSSVQVTVSGRWKTLYDQGGLVMSFPSDAGLDRNARWIKAGIEYVDGAAHLGVVATDALSDWSLSPILELAEQQRSDDDEVRATVVIERSGRDAWVYALEGAHKRALRQITWAFNGDVGATGVVEVGIYGAKPTREAGAGHEEDGIAVTLTGFVLNTVDGPVR